MYIKFFPVNPSEFMMDVAAPEDEIQSLEIEIPELGVGVWLMVNLVVFSR